MKYLHPYFCSNCAGYRTAFKSKNDDWKCIQCNKIDGRELMITAAMTDDDIEWLGGQSTEYLEDLGMAVLSLIKLRKENLIG